MDFRSKPCVFLGYSPNHLGYRCLDISSGPHYISRHVKFSESKFPFGQHSSSSPTHFLYHPSNPSILGPVPSSILGPHPSTTQGSSSSTLTYPWASFSTNLHEPTINTYTKPNSKQPTKLHSNQHPNVNTSFSTSF